jgi:hypothetical protein
MSLASEVDDSLFSTTDCSCLSLSLEDLDCLQYEFSHCHYDCDASHACDEGGSSFDLDEELMDIEDYRPSLTASAHGADDFGGYTDFVKTIRLCTPPSKPTAATRSSFEGVRSMSRSCGNALEDCFFQPVSMALDEGRVLEGCVKKEEEILA